MAELSEQERQAQIELLKRMRQRGTISEQDYRAELLELGFDPAALPGQVVPAEPQPPEAATTPPDLSSLRERLNRLDDTQIESLTLDRFPAVHDKFARGLQRGEKINLLLEHCHLHPEAVPVLERWLNHSPDTCDPTDALGCYLRHVAIQNRYLPLQGIRSGGRLVSIELEQIYVTLRATRQRTVRAEEEWLAAEAKLAPGESHRMGMQTEAVVVSVNEALAEYRRLIVLGDPGCGKTTLLRYLALLYARDLNEGTSGVRDRLGLNEQGCLPILLPLRRLGAYLRAHHPVDDGTEGHKLLLDHLCEMLGGERIALSPGFFDPYLEQGQAVILLDGLDEVADPALRQRVSKLVEAFTAAYPRCRYVVTSRVVGYTGTARLGQDYVTTMVRDFTDADIVLFLYNWHLAVAVSQMGEGQTARAWAETQTQSLQEAMAANERVRELALNPLLLTVIALVHRERVKLPDRRAELYAEAVDVLLGKWDEAKQMQEVAVLADQPFDAGDKRLLLQQIALSMHEKQQKEMAVEDLRRLVGEYLHEQVKDWRESSRSVDRFLQVIEERAGLLIGRGEGVYAFSHLTFQEYLAALAVAAREDYLAYTVQRCADPWWREVILLEAGYLSTQSRQRTTQLLRAIADCQQEAEPYHNLVLAAEGIHDVGTTRVEGDLLGEIVRRLRRPFETPLRLSKPEPTPDSPTRKTWWQRVMGAQTLSAGSVPAEPTIDLPELIRRRAAAAEALAKIESGTPGTQPAYWRLPYGEPAWVEVPAGEFWMGGEGEYDGEPVHRLNLDAFQIARVPVTNAQYHLFVEAEKHKPPSHWDDGRIPRGLESHPVVQVTWHDAMAYCHWLSEMTGKTITLPSEAQWEKAARGGLPPLSSPPLAGGKEGGRIYPWGDEWDESKCNTRELGLGSTTPVGIFPEGVSPYGCLDMAGNVWEWTRSIYKEYPYDPADGRENLEAGDSVARVLRGGSFGYHQGNARCSVRGGLTPVSAWGLYGFRVVVSPIPPP